MYKKVFRRDEKKYLLAPAQYEALMREISAYIQPDEYFETTICSLYLDTAHYDLIIKSIEKPLYKQKIRLRSYGVPQPTDTVFLESKIKYQGIVSKRRIKIGLQDFYHYYENYNKHHPITMQSVFPQNSFALRQITREFDHIFQIYRLEPSFVISYDRKSYCSVDDPDLRITFDHNLRSRSDHLCLEAGSAGECYFKDGTCVMEIKALEAMPLWLVQALSRLHIYPVSFTKYGKIYESSKGNLC